MLCRMHLFFDGLLAPEVYFEPPLIWEQYCILNTWINVSIDLYKLLFYQTQNNISMVMFESPQETSGKFSKTFPDDWVVSDTPTQ